MKKIYIVALLLLGTQLLHAQTTYLQSGTPEYHLLERLETMNGVLTDDFSSTIKPISRKEAVRFLTQQKNDVRFPKAEVKSMGYIDYQNMERALSISGEWTETTEGEDGAIDSKRPILRYFYQKQPDMIHVNTDDFFMVINPVIYAQLFAERNSSNGTGYINTRGVELRARIFNKVGFYTMLADNQEKSMSYVRALESSRGSYPGFDYYTHSSATAPYDAFLARGYFDFSLLQEHVNITFGYDKNFVGDGLRSLMISETGAPATFLRLRSKIWKLNYENLFLELMPDYARGGDRILPKKYAAMHQININVIRWLNIGIFESTMFGKANHISATNFVPVILFQSAARALGAEQKTSLGLNFKMIPVKNIQVYGQGYFDQIKPGELGDSWWGNQFGMQLGAKYFDAFTISNLDIQAEANIVRPFTYSAADTVTNYTHYNQPIAHPYGAGFVEFIGQIKYQPLHNLYFSAKGIYSVRGYDDASTGLTGYDIFAPNNTRPHGDYGYKLTGYNKVKGLYANINIAYEVRPNIFFEIGATGLKRDNNNLQLPTVIFGYGGLRWNISRREYDFY